MIIINIDVFIFILKCVVYIGYSSLPRSTMSEPLGCSDQVSSAYCPDSAIPLLETVSEEARRQTGNNLFFLTYN